VINTAGGVQLAGGQVPGTTADATGACLPSGAVPGGMSFTAATQVLLPGGKTAPIASLKPGDKVEATNTATGKTSPETVAAVEVHHDTNLYDLNVKTPRGVQVIHTTANHLFWDPATKQWVPAGKLKNGEHLKTPDGTTAVADGGSVPAQHDGWMWDLTVPGNNDHDFYVVVAATAVLVHNCPAGSIPRSGGVYTLRDPETGAVVRTGRAASLAERALTHARTPELSQFRFQVEYRTSDFNTQVGLEQMLYNRYPEARAANGGFNKYAPVVEYNPMYETYMQAARDYLAGLEGG
jgi:hypothetical protein